MLKAELVSRHYGQKFSGVARDIKVYGPIPAPISMLRGYYRWQILLRAVNPEQTLPMLDSISKHEGVSITVDVDPVSML